jgi:hypothetical protein
MPRTSVQLLGVPLAWLAAACAGGGGSDTTPPTPAPETSPRIASVHFTVPMPTGFTRALRGESSSGDSALAQILSSGGTALVSGRDDAVAIFVTPVVWDLPGDLADECSEIAAEHNAQGRNVLAATGIRMPSGSGCRITVGEANAEGGKQRIETLVSVAGRHALVICTMPRAIEWVEEACDKVACGLRVN